MIALQAIEPEPQPRQVERGRSATRERIRRARRHNYFVFLRVGAIAAALVLPLMLYVMLTANLTTLNYKLARVQAQKSALLAETMRQEDRIAKLESRERLLKIAARLHMHDPGMYAVVTLPAAPQAAPPPHGVALLGAMNQWLSAAAGGRSH
jgi:cell division protein FtsB